MAPDSMEIEYGSRPPPLPNWQSRGQDSVAYTFSSSISGTVSTTYTSGGSHLSSGESPMHRPLVDEEQTADRLMHIEGLVDEFFGKRKTSTNRSIAVGHGNLSVLERWFSDAKLHHPFPESGAVDASAGSSQQLRHFAGSWNRALDELIGTASHAISLPFSEERESVMHLQIQFTQFVKKTITNILRFVGTIVALNTSTSNEILAGTWRLSAEKVQVLIDVSDAISCAIHSLEVQLRSSSSEEVGVDYLSLEIQLHSSSSEEVGVDYLSGMIHFLVDVLRVKQNEVDEAIWNTMEDVRTRIGEPLTEDSSSWGSQTLHGSASIHKLTRSVTSYIKLLQASCDSMDLIVHKATELHKYKPEIDDINPFTSLLTEMVSRLEKKLARIQQTFPDHTLGFLFLINNSHFIWHELHSTSACEYHMPFYTCKTEAYIQKYLEVSWEPVMLCLYHATPLCLGIYSPQPKFKSEFWKTCNAQKLWKVPDPVLRMRLREAIIKKVTSGFTKYLEENSIASPVVTPQELKEQLKELFEG